MEDEIKYFDLDTLTLANSSGREIFNPESKSAWPDASDRVYVQTTAANRTHGVIQIGYDPVLDETFVRAHSGVESARWSSWLAVEAPPPPPETIPEADEGDDTKRGGKKGAAKAKEIDDEDDFDFAEQPGKPSAKKK